MIHQSEIKHPCVGIDPDLHCISMAHVTATDTTLLSFKVPKELKGLDTIPYFVQEFASHVGKEEMSKLDVFIEGQAIIQSQGKKIRKQNIVELANMAGAIAGACGAMGANVRLVLPFNWKGTVKKVVHQRRICQSMGWEWVDKGTYVAPLEEDLDYVESVIVYKGNVSRKLPNMSDWKHILDSIGLSLYGAEQLAKR